MKFLLTFLSFFTFSIYLDAASISSQEIAQRIQATIDNKLQGPNKDIIKNIYEQNNFMPLWIGDENSKRQSELIQSLNDPLYNYKNKPFGRKNIKQLFYILDNNEISPDQKIEIYARLDMMMSNSFVSLVRFIVEGDVDWNLLQKKMKALKTSDDIEARWEITPKMMPSTQEIKQGLMSESIINYFNTLLPMESKYRKLVSMLVDYQNMSKLPQIPYTNDVLKIGDSDSRIEDIKTHLQISGDYPKDAKIDDEFDAELERAAISYQRRYNLKDDGQIDKVMTYYLNLPVKKNIQQIIANLDKCKLYPKSFEDEYIEVNIPDFNLRYFRNSQMIFKTGVVVGRIDRPTPIFNNYIRFMVLNPTWTVPDNLIKRDLIHVFRENPNYLEENNIRVFSGDRQITISPSDINQYENNDRKVPYRFVQYPGDNNALGRVKFMFPNKYDVYLHDTDNKSLLERRYKIYSSGCVRVDKPFDLVHLLLENTSSNYSQERIDQILATLEPTTINLPRPVPVHIVYFTVYKENGIAYFKNDIYLYDQMIWESVEGHKKAAFKLPEKRFIDVNKNGQSTPNPKQTTEN